MNLTDRIRNAFGWEEEEFVPDHPGDWDTKKEYEFQEAPGFHPSPLPSKEDVEIMDSFEYRLKLDDLTYYTKGVEIQDDEGEPEVHFLKVWLDDDGNDIGGTYRIYNDVYDENGEYSHVEIEARNFGPDSVFQMALRDSALDQYLASGFAGYFLKHQE